MILFPYRIYSFITDTKQVLLRLRYVSFAWIDCISTAIACKTIFTYLTICYLNGCQANRIATPMNRTSLWMVMSHPQTSSLPPALENRRPYHQNDSTVTEKKRRVQHEMYTINVHKDAVCNWCPIKGKVNIDTDFWLSLPSYLCILRNTPCRYNLIVFHYWYIRSLKRPQSTINKGIA